MREFLFLRHGETDWNLTDRIQGQIKSVPLNARGIQQAKDAALLLTKQSVDLIVSSTLDRASVTAEIIAERIKRPVIYDERLIEIGWSQAEGKTIQEVFTSEPEAFPEGTTLSTLSFYHFHPKGSETREQLADRASGALFDLLLQQAGKKLLIVSHGAWLRALMRRLNGNSISFANAVPHKATETEAGWVVEPLV